MRVVRCPVPRHSECWRKNGCVCDVSLIPRRNTRQSRKTGLPDLYIPNTYVPKGMQAMYGEPFSAFGRGNKKKWDGESKQGSLGPESKIILQRGTRFRDTKGEKADRIYIDMEVIKQGAEP